MSETWLDAKFAIAWHELIELGCLDVSGVYGNNTSDDELATSEVLPMLLDSLSRSLEKVCVISNAFYSEALPYCCRDAQLKRAFCALSGTISSNSGSYGHFRQDTLPTTCTRPSSPLCVSLTRPFAFMPWFSGACIGPHSWKGFNAFSKPIMPSGLRALGLNSTLLGVWFKVLQFPGGSRE